MILLDEVHIEELRGIRKLTLTMNRKSFAIHGPNGSGKSGVVDAIEFGLTGDMSRLSGKGTAGLSVKFHGPHIDARDYPDKAFVRLKLYIPQLDKSVTLTRKVKSPTAIILDPDEPDIRAVLKEVENHPEFTLTRRQIIRFILTEASNRSKDIQALLRLEAIDGTRASLKTATNKTKTAEANAVSTSNAATDSLRRHLDLEDLASADVIEVINKRRKTLGLEIISELKAETSFSEGMSEEQSESSGPVKESAARDIQALQDTLALEQIDGESPADILTVQIEKVVADPDLLVSLQHRSFIQRGLQFADSDECPLCNEPWELASLKAHLNEKLAKSKEAETVEQELKKAAQRLGSEVIALRTIAQTVQKIANQLGDKDTERALQGWLDDLIALKTSLVTVEGAVEALERISNDWRQVPDGLADSIESLSTKLKAIPDRSTTVNATKFLIVAQERLEAYRKAKRDTAKRERAATIARKVYKAYCTASETVLTELYKDVQETFAKWYGNINRDDEENFSAKLSPSEGKLELDVDFHERGLYHPGAYHSEGHQDGMGLCLYLALMRQLLGNDFHLAVLDDVVMSVDSQHRKELCALLKAEFPDTQFIITTHEQAWFYQMQHAGLVTRKSSAVFRNWTVDDGPMVCDATNAWEDIEAALAEDDVPRAAAALRRHLEFVSGELADCLGASVPYRADGNHDLGDLLPNVIGQFNKLLKKSAESAQAWNNENAKSEIAARKIIFSAVASKCNVEQWAVNKAVHFNAWANFVREDFEPVITAYRELLECFMCPNCGSWLHVTPRRGPKESLRCDCSHISLNMTPKT